MCIRDRSDSTHQLWGYEGDFSSSLSGLSLLSGLVAYFQLFRWIPARSSGIDRGFRSALCVIFASSAFQLSLSNREHSKTRRTPRSRRERKVSDLKIDWPGQWVCGKCWWLKFDEFSSC